jgi:hypothetical protein
MFLRLAKEVYGDRIQALELHHVYVMLSNQFLQKRLHDNSEELLQTQNVIQNQHQEDQEIEVDDRLFAEAHDKEFKDAKLFVEEVDRCFEIAIGKCACGWQRHNSTLLDLTIDDDLMKKFGERLPLISKTLLKFIMVKSETGKRAKAFANFLAMHRQRNNKALVHWAAVQKMCLMAEGRTGSQIEAVVSKGGGTQASKHSSSSTEQVFDRRQGGNSEDQ